MFKKENVHFCLNANMTERRPIKVITIKTTRDNYFTFQNPQKVKWRRLKQTYKQINKLTVEVLNTFNTAEKKTRWYTYLWPLRHFTCIFAHVPGTSRLCVHHNIHARREKISDGIKVTAADIGGRRGDTLRGILKR